MKIAIAVLALVLAVPTFAGIGGPKGFEKTLGDATFALYGNRIYKGKPEIRFLCTVTVFEKLKGGYGLLGAGHCVADMPSDVTFSVAEDLDKPRVSVTPFFARNDGDKGNEDIAVFYLMTDKKYPVIPLGDESGENVGNGTYNVSFSESFAKQWNIGRISTTAMGAACGAKVCIGYFVNQAYGGPGASGSAVVSAKTHKIIGVTILGRMVGMGIEPASMVKKILAEPDMYQEIHQVDETDSKDN